MGLSYICPYIWVDQLTYTKETAGSSPVPPTLVSPGMGVLIKKGSRYGGLVRQICVLGSNRGKIGCSWDQFAKNLLV